MQQSPESSEFGNILDIVPPFLLNDRSSNFQSLIQKEDSLFTRQQDVILIPPVLPKNYCQNHCENGEQTFVATDELSKVGRTRPKTIKLETVMRDPADDQIVERRERNREHAKRSRIRKKLLLDSLQDQLVALRKENTTLRRTISDRIPHLAAKILSECTTTESELLSDSLSSDFCKPSPLTSNIAQQCLNGLRLQQQSVSSKHRQVTRVLVEADYRLMQTLVTSQQNFVLSDPSLPDNPIVYVSEGFCRMTGYKRQDVVGRNCRFLQGPGTDPAAVDIIKQGIREGRDISVCLLNYKADGKPFWNQFFMAPLKDGSGQIVNFVGVQCEVNTIPVTAMKDRVKKLPIPEDV